METWLLEWSYMKNTTCAWYFRGENTMSFDCRMLLQTCKTAGEGKQMSCFKWWRMNWQTPIAEGRTNLKIWNFSFFLFSLFSFFWGRCKHLTSRRNTITGSYMCVYMVSSFIYGQFSFSSSETGSQFVWHWNAQFICWLCFMNHKSVQRLKGRLWTSDHRMLSEQ